MIQPGLETAALRHCKNVLVKKVTFFFSKYLVNSLRLETRESAHTHRAPFPKVNFFAGLLERAILPEATGRCKRLD